MNDEYISFFHCSDIYLEQYSSREKGRPTFYWFSDCFHHHMNQRRTNWYSYFNLFVKNPRNENIPFRARHQPDGDFNSLYRYFSHYRKQRAEKIIPWMLGKEYLEPGIIMSFNPIIPDIIARFESETSPFVVIIKPDKYKGRKIRLMTDDRVPIHFLKIPELVEIVTEIEHSFPFVEPKKIEDKFVYDNWFQLTY